MVSGQERQATATQPIGARVADVHDVRDAAAQHESGESATHPRQVRVPLALGVHPCIEGAQDAGGRPLHFRGLRHLAHSIQKAPYSSLRRDAPPLCAPDPIGDRRNDVSTWVREI